MNQGQRVVYVIRYTYRGEGFATLAQYATRREAEIDAAIMRRDKWQGVHVERRVSL